MRTFVVTNYTEGSGNVYPAIETWAYYPDAEPVRSFYPGDQRAALAPFLAHRELGDSFKWLLYGDDDTVFFPDAALSLASTLDPALPYVVTDNIWWSPLFGDAYHPNPQASIPTHLLCFYLLDHVAWLEYPVAALSTGTGASQQQTFVAGSTLLALPLQKQCDQCHGHQNDAWLPLHS